MEQAYFPGGRPYSMGGQGDAGAELPAVVAPPLSSPWERDLGVGQNWRPVAYGAYYAKSALGYSAIKVRQDAVARVPLQVYRRPEEGVRGPGYGVRRAVASAESYPDARAATSPPLEPVGPDHQTQRLLDSPNPFWTRGDLWRATETYLSLWGSAFWGLERDEMGRVVEIWPLRSDGMRVVPDPRSYVRGFVYVGHGRQLVSYVPEDVVWLRYFNPQDEYAGLSPIAAVRLSADIGMDALRAGCNALTNDSAPGLFIETSDSPTDEEVKEFYDRWESRYRGELQRPLWRSLHMIAIPATTPTNPLGSGMAANPKWSTVRTT